MPTAYHISDDEGLITVQVDDAVDLADLYQTAQALHADGSYSGARPLLVDLRGMRLKLEKAALTPFNTLIVDNFGANRTASTAVVVDHRMDSELTAAIYWLSCAVKSCEMFDDYDHALRWLIVREFANSP